MRRALSVCAGAVVLAAVALAACPPAAAMPFPTTATSAAVDVSVSPSLIQAELGSFLWIAQTEVGSVKIRNSGSSAVSLEMQFSDAMHDMWGSVRAAGSSRAASILTVEPRYLVVMPGASGVVRIRADSSVALKKTLGAAAVLSITARPVVSAATSIGAASTATAAGTTSAGAATGARVDVTVLVKPSGARRAQGSPRWLWADGLTVGADGAWIDVHNDGPFYTWASGKIEVRRGGSRVSVPVPDSLILPGCMRRLSLTGLAEMGLSEGGHEVVIKLNGEEATTSVLNVVTQASPSRP